MSAVVVKLLAAVAVSSVMRIPLHLVVFLAAASFAAEPTPPIDWGRARELFQRSQRGEKLTDEDQQYLDRAKKLRAAGRQQETAQSVAPAAHYTPLVDLKEKYQGQEGGLYGEGSNTPSKDLKEAAGQASKSVRPLNRDGAPAEDGKIVLLSIGMSNTTQEFSAFKARADRDPRKSDTVVIVDGAQGGQDAPAWDRADSNPWAVAEKRLEQSGVSPKQVQVIWLKQAIKGPTRPFPAESDRLAIEIRKIIDLAREKYPNLRIVFLSSRIYAGYARSKLNPEPFAYESAFSVQKVIREQDLKGKSAGPVLLWGPYLWADGEAGRTIDGLKWLPEDFGPDGTHPSDSGRQKVAGLLLDFFASDSVAQPWFVKGN
jgi:hypothetical protein